MIKENKKKAYFFVGRSFILVSIVLLLYGFYLDSKSSTRLVNPNLPNDSYGPNIIMIDVVSYDGDDSDIDEEEIVSGEIPSKGGSKIPGGTSSGKVGSSSGGKTGGNTSGGNSGGDTGGSSSGSGGTGGGYTPQPPKQGDDDPEIINPPTLSYEVENNNLRNQIQGSYNVTVKYGSETDGMTVGDLSVYSITNAATINSTLNQLNTALSHYPSGFFEEIKNNGMPLTIYLVNSFSIDGITGVTDSNYSFGNIWVAVAYPFYDTFYHESYHFIERYIYKKNINYNSWGSFNPQNFQYGSLNRSLSYSRTFSEDAYFVNDYAQTAEAEDRASTFEYMMADTKASCLNQNKPIWKKANSISNAIDAAMTRVSPNVIEYWERFL